VKKLCRSTSDGVMVL